MLCRKPFMRGRIPFGCGQCAPCRLNRRRQWTWRQYLESLTHDQSCFVTLTYAPEYLPENGSLSPRHLQLWLKRIRFELSPVRVRYFGVGEYGEEKDRPHYHISLFGVPWSALPVRSRNAFDPRKVELTSWRFGQAFVAEFNETTAQYISGYVVKKLTRPDDVRLLPGQLPEFARMSLRPGIGKEAMRIVAESLSRSGLLDEIDGGDVPRELKLGRRSIPLGRFLLKALREAVGFTPEYIEELKAKGSYDQSLEMSALLMGAIENSPLSTARTAYLESVHQKILQAEARAALFKKVTKL